TSLSVVTLVVLVAIGAGACGSSSLPTAASEPAAASGGLRFPARLLGLSRNTSEAAEDTIHAISSTRVTERKNISGFQAAIYGYSGHAAIYVSGFRWSSVARRAEESHPSTFYKGFATGLAKASGSTDLRSFPVGQQGGALFCGHVHNGIIVCGWVEKVRAGSVLYFNGAASSLGDAASKASQIRAAIEP